MNVQQLIRLCAMYSREGSSVHDQLQSVLEGADYDDLNPNALELIRKFFSKAASCGVEYAEEYAEDIQEYLADKG